MNGRRRRGLGEVGRNLRRGGRHPTCRMLTLTVMLKCGTAERRRLRRRLRGCLRGRSGSGRDRLLVERQLGHLLRGGRAAHLVLLLVALLKLLLLLHLLLMLVVLLWGRLLIRVPETMTNTPIAKKTTELKYYCVARESLDWQF